MTSETVNQNPDEQPILALIQRIKDGLFDPKFLAKDQRIQCVEVLSGEAMTEAVIAQYLKVSIKTVTRDIQAIRERNALTPNVNFAKQIIGELVHKARLHHGHLMRLARNKETSAVAKVQAEFSAWRVLNEMIERLQTLGYLPQRPTEITGDLYHHLSDDSEKSIEEIKKMIIEIEVVSKEAGQASPEVEEELKRLKDKIEKAEIIQQVNKLSQKQQEPKQDKENQNDK
ncbi:MAG: hypothetical protein WC515_05510 [Candidatus Omnitrophota bacterium]